MNGYGSFLVPLMLAGSMLFANVEIGSPLPNPTLAGVDGVERSLLAEGQVSAFVFFNPEMERSLSVLEDLGKLRQEMADKPVRWIAVFSDRFDEEAMRAALDKAGTEMETIIDTGDALYGEIGVRLYPSIGIADPEGVLEAYLPYAKINYMESVKAHLQHALGEIDDEGLQVALKPKSVDFGGDEAAAGRNIKFARMLLKSGKADKALEKAEAAVSLAPESAEAHALLAAILAELGNCEGAVESANTALGLDPENSTAKAALEQCG